MGRSQEAGAGSKRNAGDWAKRISTVTAVVVALGALVNALVDLYQYIAKIPTTPEGKANVALFEKHFHELPVLSQTVAIKQSAATLDMLLDVYGDGDIFVRYGTLNQWFPAKAVTITSAHIPLFPTAYAQGVSGLAAQGAIQQRSVINPRVELDLGKIAKKPSTETTIVVAPSAAAVPDTIERAYVVARTKDDHRLFGGSSQKYTDIFRAETGYKISKYAFQPSSLANGSVDAVVAVDGGRAVQVSYTLRSGAAYDQWRGWIKGTLQTTQAKIN